MIFLHCQYHLSRYHEGLGIIIADMYLIYRGQWSFACKRPWIAKTPKSGKFGPNLEQPLSWSIARCSIHGHGCRLGVERHPHMSKAGVNVSSMKNHLKCTKCTERSSKMYKYARETCILLTKWLERGPVRYIWYGRYLVHVARYIYRKQFLTYIYRDISAYRDNKIPIPMLKKYAGLVNI